MIKFEDMPDSAQKAYKLTNNIRKIALIVGWVIFVGTLIWGIVGLIQGDDITFLEVLFSSCILSSMILGLIHLEYAFKSLFKALWVFAVFLCAFLIALLIFGGWIFLLVDTVLFFMKKPLIYPFENKYFLQSKEAQVEMVLDAVNGNTEAAVAMKDMEKLKEMLDKGLITEDDYNDKKQELLKKF